VQSKWEKPRRPTLWVGNPHRRGGIYLFRKARRGKCSDRVLKKRGDSYRKKREGGASRTGLRLQNSTRALRNDTELGKERPLSEEKTKSSTLMPSFAGIEGGFRTVRGVGIFNKLGKAIKRTRGIETVLKDQAREPGRACYGMIQCFGRDFGSSYERRGKKWNPN